MEEQDILNNELKEMRLQVSLLKNKLEQESIVSDKLLRDTMKRKASTINNQAWISVAASLIVIIWALAFLPGIGFSWFFICATILMMLCCDFFTWKYHKDVNKKTMNGDLVTVATVMKKLKRNYQNWVKYGITMIAVWFVWMLIEYGIILQDWRITLVVGLSLLFGLAIGGFIGWRMHKSVINNAEDIIQQIEE